MYSSNSFVNPTYLLNNKINQTMNYINYISLIYFEIKEYYRNLTEAAEIITILSVLNASMQLKRRMSITALSDYLQCNKYERKENGFLIITCQEHTYIKYIRGKLLGSKKNALD